MALDPFDVEPQHIGVGHGPAGSDSTPGRLGAGRSTATGTNVRYRLGKIRTAGLLRGAWLDCGCAEAGYTFAMPAFGAGWAIGVDLDPGRVAAAQRDPRAGSSVVRFAAASSEALPFRDGSFDGVFLNEVLEHVADEAHTLREVHRVLRPGGTLALMSPNRWFPFEGHGMRLPGRVIGVPVPLLPWLPRTLALRFMRARNYWPGELRRLVENAGLDVIAMSPVFPIFEVYPWLPGRVIRWYRGAMPWLESLPIVRRFGVSTCILARRHVNSSTL
jgi:SAM-dependent methyltransferase